MKKRTLEVLVRSVTREQREESELSEELEAKVRMHQGSQPSPFLLAVVVDIVLEFVTECALSEILYAADFVLMGDTIEGLWDKFLKW